MIFTWIRQVLTNIAGLVLFAVGIVLNLQASIGLGPWDVLHQGITRHTPLTFGQASQTVGAVVIGIGLLLGVRPRLGTLLNIVLVGYFTDQLLSTRLVPSVAPYGLAVQLTVYAVGVLIIGLGTGLYLRANLGAGPRDGLMMGVHGRTKYRIAIVRGVLEALVLTLGFLLGGSVGIGTLIFAIGIGPAVELGFRVFGAPRRTGEKS
jgi:uncharacterized protein